MLRTALVLSSLLSVSLSAALTHAGALEAPVVGGTNVPAGEWPDAVAVIAPGAMCTGTLIAPDVVLTAGHCIETRPTYVIVGSVDLGERGGERVAVKWSRAYPSWMVKYDVGVVVLDHPVFVKPRAVAAACTVRDHLRAGAKVHLVGFGLTTKSGTGNNTRLHEAMLPVVDPKCTEDPACNPAIAPNGEFAAGGHGTDACYGDSGGPIYIDTLHGPALIGVVSRGTLFGNAPCGSGGIYVRADKVVSWIQSTTDRKLVRATCDRPSDEGGEGDGDGDEADGGCSVSGHAVGGSLLVLVAVLWLLTIPRKSSAKRS